MENQNEIKQGEINVISKEEYEKRIKVVFNKLGDAISKSFGPYGSNTLVSVYPNTFTTKDGYSIMKYLTFSDPLDRIFADMAKDISNRLNLLVGDGTSTATIATNKIYDVYSTECADVFKNYIPRDILSRFKAISADVIQQLKTSYTNPIPTEKSQMIEVIKNIVEISSNGDSEITNNISELYGEIGYPCIDVTLSNDGITRSYAINGYTNKITLINELFVNSEDGTFKHDNCIFVLFDHKVSESAYRGIIEPIHHICKTKGRHIVVIAPTYDEMFLNNYVKPITINEYRQLGKTTFTLCTIPAMTAMHKKRFSDLAMLLDTSIITNNEEFDILMSVGEGSTRILDHIIFEKSDERKDDIIQIQLGSCKSTSIGDTRAVFSGFDYNEGIYNAHLEEAEKELAKKYNTHKNMGTFNVEVMEYENRLNALKLKMGIIEVGGQSTFTQQYTRDIYNDAVKAAESAYNNGYIMGCNVSLLLAISDLIEDESRSELDIVILNLLFTAFKEVYKTVLSNAYPENYSGSLIIDDEIICKDTNKETTINNIISTSLEKRLPFDVVNKIFSNRIINSSSTDEEVLKATIDLLSLIISGNQLVVTNI